MTAPEPDVTLATMGDWLDALRREHRADVHDQPGGWSWSCSCGALGSVGASYPTQAQASSRLARHLRAAGDRIRARPGLVSARREIAEC